MKKLLYLIIGFLLFIPFYIHADMSAPGIIEYDAIVSNKDGAYFYVYDDLSEEYVVSNKKINYNAKVKVVDEWDKFATLQDYDDYVLISDLTPANEVYKVNEKELGEKFKSYVLKDTQIVNGPAAGYKSSGVVIPSGSVVELREIDEGSMAFCYVEYKGIKGFINILDDNVTMGDDKKDILFDKDTKMYDAKTGKEIQTILLNTKVSLYIYYLNPWSRNIYLEYNGKKGLVDKYSFVEKNDKIKFKTSSKVKVYSNADEELLAKNKVDKVTTIAKGTTFKSEYYDLDYVCKIYYENNNIKGWVNVYRDTDDGECNGIKYTLPDNEDDEDFKINNGAPYIEEVDSEEKPNNDKPNVIKPSSRNTNNQTLIIYIMGAVILCLTAIITILLVNKNKKSK